MLPIGSVRKTAKSVKSFMKIVLSKESIFLERTNITTRFLQKLLILIFQILFFIDFYCLLAVFLALLIVLLFDFSFSSQSSHSVYRITFVCSSVGVFPSFSHLVSSKLFRGCFRHILLKSRINFVILC